ncbi:hypothetical protein F4680DRAFT_447071 [Xylaria scruposa]|nr:hypothetical protein F4680DRAFT_447071 [Xylaria scruposa]
MHLDDGWLPLTPLFSPLAGDTGNRNHAMESEGPSGPEGHDEHADHTRLDWSYGDDAVWDPFLKSSPSSATIVIASCSTCFDPVGLILDGSNDDENLWSLFVNQDQPAEPARSQSPAAIKPAPHGSHSNPVDLTWDDNDDNPASRTPSGQPVLPPSTFDQVSLSYDRYSHLRTRRGWKRRAMTPGLTDDDISQLHSAAMHDLILIVKVTGEDFPVPLILSLFLETEGRDKGTF